MMWFGRWCTSYKPSNNDVLVIDNQENQLKLSMSFPEYPNLSYVVFSDNGVETVIEPKLIAPYEDFYIRNTHMLI